jgi:hypothetical protein
MSNGKAIAAGFAEGRGTAGAGRPNDDRTGGGRSSQAKAMVPGKKNSDPGPHTQAHALNSPLVQIPRRLPCQHSRPQSHLCSLFASTIRFPASRLQRGSRWGAQEAAAREVAARQPTTALRFALAASCFFGRSKTPCALHSKQQAAPHSHPHPSPKNPSQRQRRPTPRLRLRLRPTYD